MKKKFHLGDILTVTTGKLVAPRMMEAVYEILNFLTQDNLYTHQIPRALRFCGPLLLEQLPQLKEVDSSNLNASNAWDWLDKQVARYGEHLEIESLPEGSWTQKDPIAEIVEMVGPERVIVAAS